MPRSINEGFDDFHKRLTPTATETARATSHRASIKARIESTFGLRRFFRTGSFGNGTSISGYSDVDYFASIPRASLKADSRTTLTELSRDLGARFPNTGVRVDSPAVLIPFGTDISEATEVVPADFIEKNAYDRHIYDIPDGTGGWMRASPDAHNAYVHWQNTRLNGKVKPLIRFIKAWKYFRSVPISSFYIEMYVAEYCSNENTIVYSIDIENIFENMWDEQLKALADPMGISSPIQACKSQAERTTTLAALKLAKDRSANAQACVSANKISDAFDWYDKLYYYEFPSYYY